MVSVKARELARTVFPNATRRASAKNFSAAAKEYFGENLRAVILAGSVAADRSHSQSDVDLLLVVKNEAVRDEKYGEMASALFRLARKHGGPNLRIDYRVLRESDFQRALSHAAAHKPAILAALAGIEAPVKQAQLKRLLFRDTGLGLLKTADSDPSAYKFPVRTAAGMICLGAVPLFGHGFLRSTDFYRCRGNMDAYSRLSDADVRKRTLAAAARRLRLEMALGRRS